MSESESEDEIQNEQSSETNEKQDSQSAEISAEETTDPDAVDTDTIDEDNQIGGILAIRETARSATGKLVGHEFDGVTEVSPRDEGWRAIVEAVERSSIPDTQDVIGRYEIEIDEDGVIQGYRRLNRYRRGDTTTSR